MVLKKYEINKGGLVEARLGQFKPQPDPVVRAVFQFAGPANYRIDKILPVCQESFLTE